MQQQRDRDMPVYADIGEVRMEVQAASCNRLLAEGWVLLGVYPLTTVREMEQQPVNGEQTKKQDTQRYVQRMVGYVVGRRSRISGAPANDP